ncbi:hypothetical protein BH09ACT7_BH09ACT7_23950 [soil metagenome]
MIAWALLISSRHRGVMTAFVLMTALAVLVVAELGWHRTLSAAQAAGLVAARPA